ncbi:MAG: MaoC/PaaZ C-terminal domain-containing protein [Cohaesibacter sp.]|jgi:acyl dehydratase|nr:MaoC/PaaZ C-terminal domain-containing protein [Cohaesibacter sp.]
MHYFEDFSQGDRFDLGNHTISKDEILTFALSFDPQPFHLDEEAGKASILGGLAASGWHNGAILLSLFSRKILQQSALISLDHMTRIAWTRPVYPDQTLSCKAHVTNLAQSPDDPHGIITFECQLFDEKGQKAMEFIAPAIIARKSEQGA